MSFGRNLKSSSNEMGSFDAGFLSEDKCRAALISSIVFFALFVLCVTVFV